MSDFPGLLHGVVYYITLIRMIHPQFAAFVLSLSRDGIQRAESRIFLGTPTRSQMSTRFTGYTFGYIPVYIGKISIYTGRFGQ
jgi:hypothetical protein